jgi:hypothetical protein
MMAMRGIRLLTLALVLGACSGVPADEASSRAKPDPPPPAEPESALPAPTVEPRLTPEPEATPEPEVTPEPEATPEPTPAPEPVPGPTFTVIARLVDAGRPVSHCGVIHFKVVMKFEVLRVVDGRFEPTTLYAGVSCPEMPPTRARKFRWTEGSSYEVKLRTAGLRRAGALVDAFEGESGKRYELLHIEPMSTE